MNGGLIAVAVLAVGAFGCGRVDEGSGAPTDAAPLDAEAVCRAYVEIPVRGSGQPDGERGDVHPGQEARRSVRR